MTNQTLKTWQEVKFKDFVKLQRGFDLPKQDRIEGEYPVIASTSITGYHDEYKVEPPCVTTGRSGALGEVLYIRSKCWPLNTVLWVKDFKGNDPYFVYSKLKTLHLEQYNSGAGVPTLNRNHLDQILIDLPSVEDQKKISSVLSTYDNLIENNSRRIKILEQMAQTTYTEWFVNFRFPSHEKVKMVDSGADFGKIPQGWKVATLSDLVENVRNATPSGEILKERNYVPIDLIDSQSLTLRKYNSWTEAKSSLILFEKGDILFGAMRPYFHKVAIAPFSGVTRGTCLVLRPKYDLAYCALTMFQKETIDFATANSQGATIPYINWNVLAKKKCLIPSSDVMSSYSKYIQPLLELNQRMAQGHEKLIKSRDLFLPKLVTGEIKI